MIYIQRNKQKRIKKEKRPGTHTGNQWGLLKYMPFNKGSTTSRFEVLFKIPRCFFLIECKIGNQYNR
jgi:hypothetical protein